MRRGARPAKTKTEAKSAIPRKVPEDQAAIFEEFRQVGSDETRKQFVELARGRIQIQSEAGLGSTFTFTLPVG